MIGTHTVEIVKQLWNAWDIRVLILSSLMIQAFLTFLAPHRKRSASTFLGLLLWLLYLSATAVALYVISQIAGSAEGSPEREDILAFWAPFILLHLGGPDTITALALEDNELWHRHALELTTQLVVTLYVFSLSILRKESPLWFPTALMFVDGCIKYVERTQALYYASMDSFRDSLETDPEPGPNYARFMDEYFSATSAYIPATIQGKNGPSDINIELAVNNRSRLDNLSNNQEGNSNHAAEVVVSFDEMAVVANDWGWNRVDTEKMVQEAYSFYMAFRGLLADGFLSLKLRKESRDIFVHKPGPEAFRIIQIELNFMYDVFYTKVFLLRKKQVFLRVVSFLSVTASLLIFCLLEKSIYHHVDVVITYLLLAGAIALDLSVAVLLVSSDWWIIITSWFWHNQYFKPLFSLLSKWSKMARKTRCHRWSRSISQYNLLKRCFKDPPSVLSYIFIRRISDFLISWLYVETEMIKEEEIVKFIVDELQMKAASIPDDLKSIKEVCSARGNLAYQDAYFLVSEYLNPWTLDVDYDESLLTWHLATDICYLSSINDNSHYPNQRNIKEYREISKKLSDYMTYLILRQQKLVSPIVGMSDIRFKDTCAEARKFMTNKSLDSWSVDITAKAKNLMYKMLFRECKEDEILLKSERKFLLSFCESLLKVKSDVQPIVAKGDKSKSVLFEACRLAKQLQMLGDQQWEITSKVWVELLCYAAIRCPPGAHLAKLSKGGELLTIIWLLMAHLGLGDRFLQNQGFGWTRLIIQK